MADADLTVKDPAHHGLMFDNVHYLEVGRVTVFQMIPQHFKHQVVPWIKNFERNLMTAEMVGVHGGHHAYLHHLQMDTAGESVVLHASNSIVEKCLIGHGQGVVLGPACDENLHNLTVRNMTYEDTRAGVRLLSHPNCAGEVHKYAPPSLPLSLSHTPHSLSRCAT
jgi:hypothetical protein